MATPKLAAVHGPQDAPDSAPASDRDRDSKAIEDQEEHRETVRLVMFALGATGCTQERAAKILGTSTRNLQLKLDPEGPRRMSLSSVRRLARVVHGFGEIVGAAIASTGPAAKVTAPRTPESHAMRLSVVIGDIAERTEEASSDGAITTDEARDLARLHRLNIERSQAALRDLGERTS